jgi:two-component system KDP operon response regulator KdpE
MSGPKILVVDDEAAIRRFLKSALAVNGYEVVLAVNGREALRAAAAERPDLVVLDLGLPDMAGEEVLAELRKGSRIPIVVLSARGDEGAKVRLLDLGADDYVVKPFGIDEFLARLRAALRHRFQQEGVDALVAFGSVEIDLTRHIVRRDGQPVRLSRREFDLLRYLAEHVGKVVTHRQLLQSVWGAAHQDDVEYLRVYMRQLRNKLEPEPQRPVHLLTEPGIGYRLVLEP